MAKKFEEARKSLVNPITGHNYGYFAFVPPDQKKDVDESLISMTNNGLINIAVRLGMIGFARGWKGMLLALGGGVLITEGVGGYYNSKFKEALKDKNFDVSVMKNDQTRAMINNMYYGDPSAYREAMQYIFEKKKQGVTQGSSLLEAGLTGYTLHDFVARKRWKGTDGLFIGHIAILIINAITLYKYWDLFAKDEKAAKKGDKGSNNAGGNRTAHMWHGISLLDGIGISYLTK